RRNRIRWNQRRQPAGEARGRRARRHRRRRIRGARRQFGPRGHDMREPRERADAQRQREESRACQHGDEHGDRPAADAAEGGNIGRGCHARDEQGDDQRDHGHPDGVHPERADGRDGVGKADQPRAVRRADQKAAGQTGAESDEYSPAVFHRRSGITSFCRMTRRVYAAVRLDAGYFISMPWGRAGPLAKAVSKSRLKRVSGSKWFLNTLITFTRWSPSKWILPKSSSFKK